MRTARSIAHRTRPLEHDLHIGPQIKHDLDRSIVHEQTHVPFAQRLQIVPS